MFVDHGMVMQLYTVFSGHVNEQFSRLDVIAYIIVNITSINPTF